MYSSQSHTEMFSNWIPFFLCWLLQSQFYVEQERGKVFNWTVSVLSYTEETLKNIPLVTQGIARLYVRHFLPDWSFVTIWLYLLRFLYGTLYIQCTYSVIYKLQIRWRIVCDIFFLLNMHYNFTLVHCNFTNSVGKPTVSNRSLIRIIFSFRSRSRINMMWLCNTK
jgi:hypothetical protein